MDVLELSPNPSLLLDESVTLLICLAAFLRNILFAPCPEPTQCAIGVNSSKDGCRCTLRCVVLVVVVVVVVVELVYLSFIIYFW